MADVTCRPFRAGDEPACRALHARVFGTAIDAAHWRWKLEGGPAGPALRAVALVADEVVGHLAFLPVRMRVDGQDVRGLQAVDVVADPGRWGLATGRLVTRLWKWLEGTVPAADGPSFVFGLPTPAIQPLTARVLEGVEACRVPQWVRVRNPAYLVWRLLARQPALRRRLPAVGRRRGGAPAIVPGPGAEPGPPGVRRVAAFDATFDRLWEAAAPGLGVATVRDARYLAWRYAPPGFVTYAAQEPGRTLGFVVVRVLPWEGWRVGYVADLLAPEPGVGRRLLAAALDHCRRARVDVIRAWMLDQGPGAGLLRGARFRPRPSTARLMIRELPSTRGWAFMQDARHWYVTLGDSDGV